MNAKARILSLIILLLVSGCSNKSVPPAEVTPTLTPFQVNVESPTATPGALQAGSPPPAVTSISVSSLTFTPAPGTMPSDFSPILYGRRYDANMFFSLLGGVQGGKWLTADQAASNMSGGWDYDVHTFAGESFQVYGSAARFSPPYRGFYVSTDVTVNEYGMVGVAHGWNIRQDVVEELLPENETYRQVVFDWLKTEGIKDPEAGISIFTGSISKPMAWTKSSSAPPTWMGSTPLKPVTIRSFSCARWLAMKR